MTTAPLADLMRSTIRRHAMLVGGERVLVGVSGGADSVALLVGLWTLAAEWDLSLHVLHVDHQLRAHSGRDATFVQSLARQLGVPVSVERVRVTPGGSVEAAARLVRHAALDTTATRLGAARIALGHTADDQAETVLMRLLEGTGVRGLAAIPPVRGRIVRPLVETRRRDIESALHEAGFTWIEDPTNRDPKFLRNKIRHEILPLLASVHDADVVPALARTAALARQATIALDDLASRELERLGRLEPDGALTLPLAALRAMPSFVAPEVLRQAAVRLGGTAPLRAWAHRGLARIVRTPRARRPFRVGGVIVEVAADRVRLGRTPPVPLIERTFTVPGHLELPEIGRTLRAVILDRAGYELPRSAAVVAFDADEIRGDLRVRARRSGDRIRPFGHAERRLKTLLIDAKIPRWDRARVPVVEAGGEIIWVAGVRRGATAPVTDCTRRVLELSLHPLDALR